MPVYKVTDPTSGRTIKLTGDSPPTETELNEVFASVGGDKKAETRTAGQRVAAAVAPYARPVLETGGLMLGGAVGAGGGTLAAPGAGSVAGGVLGAGLGYAAGRNIATGLEEYAGARKPETLPRNFLNAGKDVVSGAAMEAGGQVAGAASKPVTNWLAKKAPELYESALKIPPSIPNKIRNQAVNTGIEGGYAPTQKGLGKLQGNIDSLNKQIASEIDGMVQTKNVGGAKQGTISLKDAAARIDELKKFYEKLPPKVAKAYTRPLDKLQKQFASGGNITPQAAQEMKQTLYALNRKHYGELSSTIVEGNKAVARGLKEELVQQNPALAYLNSKDSALINLEEVLERAVNRTRNYDVIRLGDTVMAAAGGAAGGAGGAEAAFFLKRALESPAVKANLAFALKQAAKAAPLPTTSRMASWAAMRRNDDQ